MTAFSKMLRHINCSGIMSLADWEALFGAVSATRPYGDQFWGGFTTFMVTVYNPSMTKRRYLASMSPLWAHFELPTKFAKDSARRPKDASNTGSNTWYPCFVWPADDGCGCQLFWMVCVNLALKKSQPWLVHVSWLRFIVHAGSGVPFEVPGFVHEAPVPVFNFETMTTVTIEEVTETEVGTGWIVVGEEQSEEEIEV